MTEQAHTTSPAPTRKTPKRGLFVRIEAFISRLSAKSPFWNRLFSMIWMPYAFRSGITMKQLDDRTFQAILPFRRFNRNWYNAMAGAALLGNSEIAGGTYVFNVVGGDNTVVCKKLEYRFLRPCYGPAIYRITPREDIQQLVESGTEFNITIDMDVVQAITPERIKPGATKEKRVGRVTAVFHVTPKRHLRERGEMGAISTFERRKGPGRSAGKGESPATGRESEAVTASSDTTSS